MNKPSYTTKNNTMVDLQSVCTNERSRYLFVYGGDNFAHATLTQSQHIFT